MFLRELKQEIRYLRGVGPRLAAYFKKLGINTIAQLLLHFPRDYEDRTIITPLAQALTQKRINALVTIIAHDYIGQGYKKILKVYVKDETDTACLICFGRNFLEKTLLPGKEFFISGDFTYRYGEKQCSNFEFEAVNGNAIRFKRIIPIYALTTGISQNIIYRSVKQALLLFQDQIENELPPYIQKKYGFPDKRIALYGIHLPSSWPSLEKAKHLLKYEELFFLQLIIARKSLKNRIVTKEQKKAKFNYKQKLLERLPFKLTPDQIKVLKEIEGEILSPYQMTRLLQGEVGCGKTLVALICSLLVIEGGQQVALLAPTELLARQHAENTARLLEPIGIKVAYLSGNIKQEQRSQLLKALKQGQIDVITGTHVLFSQDVHYKSLGLVIVDEQQRFGVKQRKAIMDKGVNPDLLLMTATPIPRSLALTVFGDLQVSIIKTMPIGRKAVITHLTLEGREEKVYRMIKKELKQGRQAYFVYPLIEESDKLCLKDAESMFERLKNRVFTDYRLGLIHSRIAEDEQKKTMDDYLRGKIDILVATSVVEVGVDVPNATCMVIEHAERFGLSALHQLRGRVGRGQYQSYAFLIYSKKLTGKAIQRLKIMMQTNDGFRIAEEDLKIRGPGELLGVEQSGFLKFTIADLLKDKQILKAAREEVFRLVQYDPGLIQPENLVLRQVLDRAVPFSDDFLDSG